MTDSKSLAIREALGIERLGDILYKAGYWNDTKSQAQAIVKILAGAEAGFGPIAAMNGVYIIEGKTTWAAHLVGAAIKRSERYDYRVVEHDETHCQIDFFEKVGGKLVKLGTSSFNETDAQGAGLLDKKGPGGPSMWKKFPRNMYFSRALTNGARWYCPDVFNGPVYTPDELGVEVDESGNVAQGERYSITEQPQPQPQARPAGVRVITNADEPVWKRWEVVRDEALKYGIVPPSLTPGPSLTYDQLVSVGLAVAQQTKDKKDMLAREDAARQAAAAERAAASTGEDRDASPGAETQLPPAPEDNTPWGRNRRLVAEVERRGSGNKVRVLRNDSTPEEVEQQNVVLEAWLRNEDSVSGEVSVR